MLKKVVQIVTLAAACALLFVILPGCPKADATCDGFVEGRVYEVELQILEGDVLYAVEAEQEGDDDDDCEQEGENEGEDEDCEGEAEEDDDECGISAQVTAIAGDLSSFELLGQLTVTVEADAEAEIAVEDLAVGMWVEVEGEFEGGVLEAEGLEPADEEEIEVECVLTDLTDASFTMAGLTITYDDATEFECDDEEDDDDEEEEEEDDD